MPIRKLSDPPYQTRCMHGDHEPPNMMYLEPGTYEHECPSCHKKTIFTVGGTYMNCASPTVYNTIHVDVGNIASERVLEYVQQVRNELKA